MQGCIHSIETCGTVDGPGIRTVVFFQGCPLKCLYCHNRDTWAPGKGAWWEAEELARFAANYKTYYQATGGGVTASGGEPAAQPEFLAEFFRLCKERGIHTALDTSGYVQRGAAQSFLPYTDLVLLDIKHLDPQECRRLTGKSNDRAIELLTDLEKRGIPVVLRQVLLPGWTDGEAYLAELARFAKSFSVVQEVELLPYHKMGEVKWNNCGAASPLASLAAMSQGEAEKLNTFFEKRWKRGA